MPRLVCIAPDGDHVTECKDLSKWECIERSVDMGSRWIFYPFHFVVSDSGKTVIDAPDEFKFLERKRLNTVKRLFKEEKIALPY